MCCVLYPSLTTIHMFLPSVKFRHFSKHVLAEPNVKLRTVTTFQHELWRKSYIVKTQHFTSRNGLFTMTPLAQGATIVKTRKTVKCKVHMTGFTHSFRAALDALQEHRILQQGMALKYNLVRTRSRPCQKLSPKLFCCKGSKVKICFI